MSSPDSFPRTSPMSSSTNTLYALRKEKEGLEQRVGDARTDLIFMMIQSQCHERENINLRKRVGDLEKECASTMCEMKVLRETADDFNMQASDAQADRDLAVGELEEVCSVLETKETELERAGEEVLVAKAERGMAFAAANGLQSDLTKAKQKIQEQAKSLVQHRERCDALTEMAKSHVRATEDKSLEIQELESMIRTYKLLVSSKDEVLQKARVWFETLKTNARKKIADSEGRSSSLALQVQTLEKKLETVATLSKSRGVEIRTLKNELAAASDRLRERTAEVQNLKNDSSEKWQRVEAQRRQNEEYSRTAIERVNQQVFAAEEKIAQLQRQNANLRESLTKRRRTPSMSPRNEDEPLPKRRKLALAAPPVPPAPGMLELLDDDDGPLPTLCNDCETLIPFASPSFTISSMSRRPGRQGCTHRLCVGCHANATSNKNAFAWTCPVDGCKERFVASVAWCSGKVAHNIF